MITCLVDTVTFAISMIAVSICTDAVANVIISNCCKGNDNYHDVYADDWYSRLMGRYVDAHGIGKMRSCEMNALGLLLLPHVHRVFLQLSAASTQRLQSSSLWGS